MADAPIEGMLQDIQKNVQHLQAALAYGDTYEVKLYTDNIAQLAHSIHTAWITSQVPASMRFSGD